MKDLQGFRLAKVGSWPDINKAMMFRDKELSYLYAKQLVVDRRQWYF